MNLTTPLKVKEYIILEQVVFFYNGMSLKLPKIEENCKQNKNWQLNVTLHLKLN